MPAFAASAASSPVLDDLQKDSSFNAASYTENTSDYSLHVIQIAESTDGELLVYVYQPSGQLRDLRASSINVCKEQTATADTKYYNYNLTYINSAGVFYKYKVDGFELDTSPERYYNISNILRPYDKYVDAITGNGNTASEKGYEVAQIWKATTQGDDVVYTMTTTEVIEITEKYVGLVNYDDGVNVGWTITHGVTSAHFVAFSTDKPIEKLLEADLEYMEQDVTATLCNNIAHLWHEFNKPFNYVYGKEAKHEPITLTYHQKITHGQYSWDRIQTTKEFISNQNNAGYELTDAGEEDLRGTQWVLSFAETPVKTEIDGVWTPLIGGIVALPFSGDGEIKYTRVSDVMLLRLKFETDGKVYNLGVVDNKQTGDGISDNTPKNNGCNGFPVWAAVAIAVAAVVLLLICVIANPLNVIKFIFLLIWWIISAPFRFIIWLFKGDEDEPEPEEPDKPKKASKPKKPGKTGKKQKQEKQKKK